MTEEELLEEAAKIINVELSKPSKYLGYDKGYGWDLEPIVNKIHNLYKQAGYVQLDEKQDLPYNQPNETVGFQQLSPANAFNYGQECRTKDMRRANFKKVKGGKQN